MMPLRTTPPRGARPRFPASLPFVLVAATPLVIVIAHGRAAPRPSPAVDVSEIRVHDNRVPAGTLRGKVLTVELEVAAGRWHPEADDGPSVEVLAFRETGGPLQVPGPLLRVPQGTEIRASIRNTLPDATLVLYGFLTRPGAPDDTVHVAPGAVRRVRFEAGAPGTYHYWGTTTGRPLEGREDTDSQLGGAFVVDAAAARSHPGERVFVIGMWVQPADSSGRVPRPARRVLVINGKSWPHTERLEMAQGDTVRWRWVNPTRAPHPMHLHGFYFQVDSRGSWAADTVYAPERVRLAATELIAPGGTMSVRWVPARPGNWVFHCHFVPHISADASLSPVAHGQPHAPDAVHGMAGLVLGLHVTPGPARDAGADSTADVRRLRLLVQEAPQRYGDAPAFGFVVDGGAGAPAPDSVEVPGPVLVLERDQPVAITVVNRLRQPTAVHWHGIELESFPDGVPGWSGVPGRIMPPIAPGDSFVAEFVPPRSGTFIYHSHSNESQQISSGMYGPLLVVDPGRGFDPNVDRIVLVSAGGPGENVPGVVNGTRAPRPLVLEAGRTYRLRLININPIGQVLFTLVSEAGMARWRAVAKDGADLPPAQAETKPAWLLTGTGETADFEFTPAEPGRLRFEIATWRSPGWHVPIEVRVRAPARGAPTSGSPGR